MTEYSNDMKGVLFPNGRKESGTKQPDYTGTAEIDGTQYELAGWKRLSKSNKPFLSIVIKVAGKKKEEFEPF